MKNLFLVGDSIRMGYYPAVQKLLEGKAQVFGPLENGRFAQYTLRMLSDWKASLALPEIHSIYWNNGLWDLLHMSLDSDSPDGEAEGATAVCQGKTVRYEKDPLTPPEFYRYLLGRIIDRMHELFPGAVIAFASTTPVIEEQASGSFRSNSEIIQYNRIAAEMMHSRNVLFHDLWDFCRKNCETFHRDWLHYNKEGCRLQGEEIVSFLRKNDML